MKKKLTQILMLLVATVSVGSFVSCKDTNEDLYNELRTQVVSENAGLQQAIDQQKAALDKLIQDYKDLLAAMPAPCACDEAAMQKQIDDLKADLAAKVKELNDAINGLGTDDVEGLDASLQGLRDAIKALQDGLKDANANITVLTGDFNSQIKGLSDLVKLLQDAMNDKVGKDAFDATINGVKDQVKGINDALKALQDQNLLAMIEKNKALQDGLEKRIETLEAQLAALNTCSCNFDGKFEKYDDAVARLAKAEQAIIDAEKWVKAQLDDINGDVAAAQTAADNAFALATTANANAQKALDEAKRIEGLATAAQQAADKAQGDATAAKEAALAAQKAADLAYALAAQAAATANKVNDLAVTVATLTGKVEANEKAIEKLQQDAKDLRDLIAQNQEKLQAAIDKVNSTLEGKIDDLKDDINGKIDDLKSELQGSISDLDGKLQDKVYELIAKINEVNGSVIASAKDIEANAKAIAANTEKINGNAAAIEKIKEDVSKLDTKISLATEKANEAYKEASEAKAKADANEESISDLKKAVGVNAANIKNLQETAGALQEAVDALKDKAAQIGVNTKAIEDLTKVVDETKADVKNLGDKYNELNTKLGDLRAELAEARAECAKNLAEARGYVDTQIANLKAAVIQQIADELNNYYDKDALNKILEGYATQKDLNGLATQADVDALQGDLSELNNLFYAEILKLYDKITEGDQAIGEKLYELAQRVAANEQHLEDIDKVLKTMDEKFKDYVPRETLIAWYWLLMGRINAVDSKVDNLKDQLKTELIGWIDNDLIDDIKDQLPDLIKEVLGDDTNFVTKDQLEDLVNDLIDGKVDADDFADALADLAALEARVKALEDGTVKLGDYKVDKKKIWGAINKANEKIGDLQDAVEAINEKLPTMESDIKDLRSGLATAQAKLNEIEPKVDALRADVDAIQSYLGQQITGITIQGTYNPMFGSFSIPANIQSNILIAYYGKPSHKVEFPTTDDAYYIRKSEVLTDKDWEMLGSPEVFTQRAKKTLMNEDANGMANAGKVYVTVNPTSVDARGLNLEIVNTQDEASLITLSPLKKSYETLEFGFTRADNGFYEADAFVDKTQLDNVDGIEFDEAKLEAIINTARSELAVMAKQFFTGDAGMGGNLGKIAVDVYSIMRGLKLEQKGIKVPFKDVNGNDQAAYSQYNLAATAMKPLTLGSLKFLEDYVTIPGYEDARNFLVNDVSGALKNYVHVYFKALNDSWKVKTLTGLSFDGISLLESSENLITRFAVRLSGFSLEGDFHYFDIPAGGQVYVMFDKNLTSGGAPVAIPEDVKYDSDNCNAKRTTLVVKGDLRDGLTTMLVIPAKSDGDGAIAAYATIDLVDTFADFVVDAVTGTTDAGVVTVTDNAGTAYNVASFNGSEIVTTGYTDWFVLSNLTGSHGTVEFPVVTQISSELINLLEGQRDVLKALTTLTQDLNETLNKINNYEAVIGTQIDDFLKNYLIKYLDKINHTATYFVNSVNRRFGPFMVASNDSKGFKIMSTNANVPTTMDAAALKLYPTTKNLELIVPLARKHVAVTNVFVDGDLSASAQKGNADCLSALRSANTNDEFNTVLDGTERCIQVNKMVAGYIYEVAYSVLDFEGNISTQKYYIRINK